MDEEPVPTGAEHNQVDNGPGHNDFVKVTAPEEDTAPVPSRADHEDAPTPSDAHEPSDSHELKREQDAPHQPLEKNVPNELHEHRQQSAPQQVPRDANGHHPSDTHDDTDEPQMPGSFNVKPHHGHLSFADLLRKMHIKSH